MSYVPNLWKDRVGVGLNRWQDQNDAIYEFTSAPLSITEPGTPFAAAWLNHIEDGVKAVHDYFDSSIGIVGDSSILRFDMVGTGEGLRLFSKKELVEGAVTGSRIVLQTAYPTSVDDESDMYSSLFLYDGANTQRVTVQANTGGNCGVGIRDPLGYTRVNLRYGSAEGFGELQLLTAAGSKLVHAFSNEAGGQFQICNTSGVARFDLWIDGDDLARLSFSDIPSVVSSANAVIYSMGGGGYTVCKSTSLRKFKRDIETLTGAAAIVEGLRPVRYKPLDRNEVHFGFIAEEVAEVCDELASRDADGSLAGVNYDRVPAVLVAAMQEVFGRLSRLEEGLSV